MKFKQLIGYVADSSYIAFEIEGGDNSYSIGDQAWISHDGNRLEISDMVEQEVLDEVIQMFENQSRRAFKGALRRIGVI